MKLLQKVILAISLISTSEISIAQSIAVNAQKDSNSIRINTQPKAPIRKFYFGNSIDGAIFSTALIDRAGTNSLGTLRFSGFLHIGATYNYNFNKHVGIYTGLDLKNIGVIEKFDLFNATTKSRVYALGVPLGLRLGNMVSRNYFMLGGGVDLALHYKRKYWNDKQPKTKYNDWFSKETEILMPYVFAGIALKGTTIKIQYYPTNFFNQDFSVGTDLFTGLPIRPYANTKVNLLLLSIGRDMDFSKKKK